MRREKKKQNCPRELPFFPHYVLDGCINQILRAASGTTGLVDHPSKITKENPKKIKQEHLTYMHDGHNSCSENQVGVYTYGLSWLSNCFHVL
jgi:hypothetical protein